jgi:hypothetical protein
MSIFIRLAKHKNLRRLTDHPSLGSAGPLYRLTPPYPVPSDGGESHSNGGHVAALAERLHRVAFVTPGAIVAEIGTQVWTRLNRFVVVAVKMPETGQLRPAKFVENRVRWWIFDPKGAAVAYTVRHPAAVDARPIVAFEGQNP